MPRECSTYDVLFNDGNWYKVPHRYGRLMRLLRYYGYGHISCVEIIFNCEDSFKYIVIWRDGLIEKSDY